MDEDEPSIRKRKKYETNKGQKKKWKTKDDEKRAREISQTKGNRERKSKGRDGYRDCM